MPGDAPATVISIKPMVAATTADRRMSGLPIRGPQDPFALPIGAVNVEARSLALVRRALMQPAHQVDAVAQRSVDEPIGNGNRPTDRGCQVMSVDDVFVQPQATHDRDRDLPEWDIHDRLRRLPGR